MLFGITGEKICRVYCLPDSYIFLSLVVNQTFDAFVDMSSAFGNV